MSNKADGARVAGFECALGLQRIHQRLRPGQGTKALLAQHCGKVAGGELAQARQACLFWCVRRGQAVLRAVAQLGA